MASETRGPVLAILCGGFVAGTIDIGSACAINMLSPIVILHAIASGLLGKASYSGGLPTALLGLVLQWAMSLVIAAVYVYASRLMPVLARRWLTFGLLYGIAVFAVMSFVVVPLSAAYPKPTHVSLQGAVLNLLAMFLFGVIVAFFTNRYAGESAPAQAAGVTPA
jgi:uncharacterized membrane protein YagU involved in acid resistance